MFVQDEEIVRLLPGLHLGVDELLMARLSGLLSVAVVLVSESPPRRLSVPRSTFRSRALKIFYGVVGGAGCGEE